MRSYGKLSWMGLLIRGAIILALIVLGVILFKSIFTIVATLLTIAIIGLGIYFIIRLMNERSRY